MMTRSTCSGCIASAASSARSAPAFWPPPPSAAPASSTTPPARSPTTTWPQVITQAKTVCLTLMWSGVGAAILFTVVKALVGLRPGTDQEREGLDLVDHGERAYNY